MDTETQTAKHIRPIFSSKILESGKKKTIIFFLPSNDIDFLKNILTLSSYGEDDDFVEITAYASARAGRIIASLYRDTKKAKPIVEPTFEERRKFWLTKHSFLNFIKKSYECSKNDRSICMTYRACRQFVDGISYAQRKVAEAKANNTFEQ